MKRIVNTLWVAAMAMITVTPAAEAVDCQVRQLDWLNTDDTVLVQFSRVGEIEFTFDPTDPQDQILFDLGFVNVVLGGGDWVVQNLPLAYATPQQMLQAQPSVQFGLPIENGVPLRQLPLSVFITPEPLKLPPVGVPQFKPVFQYGYLVGGFAGGGSNLSDIPFILGPWIGPFLPLPIDIAFTDLNTTIRAVDEEKMGCAPASAARSIQYMGDVAGFATDNAQTIYEDLKDDMDTDVGAGAAGTTVPDFLTGKCEYVDENNLPIDTIQTFGLADLCDVADAVASGNDVEIMIAWSGGGGHAAMVTSMIKWPDGSVTITYIDDPTQGDGLAENQEHVIHVNPDGTFSGGSIIGFQVETLDPCPADLDGDGTVGFGDILDIIAAWGDCPGPGSCEADLNGDGEVGFADILEAIGLWGGC